MMQLTYIDECRIPDLPCKCRRDNLGRYCPGMLEGRVCYDVGRIKMNFFKQSIKSDLSKCYLILFSKSNVYVRRPFLVNIIM